MKCGVDVSHFGIDEVHERHNFSDIVIPYLVGIRIGRIQFKCHIYEIV